jgi:hypothetical protein
LRHEKAASASFPSKSKYIKDKAASGMLPQQYISCVAKTFKDDTNPFQLGYWSRLGAGGGWNQTDMHGNSFLQPADYQRNLGITFHIMSLK